MAFINTNYKQTIDALTDGYKQRMKNPYYKFIDKAPYPVTYYPINKEKSTLDQGLKIVESNLGGNSPIWFNKINNFYLYGIDQVQLALESNDFGISSGNVEGEAVILPNTIVPVPGDRFIIHHTNKPYLFKVISINKDTLESGANFYKIDYKYDAIDSQDIDKYVIEEFDTIIGNVGTDFKIVVKSNDYKLVHLIETMNEQLKEYYKMIFYRDRVESFILYKGGHYLYDPMVTEFLIRNKVLKSDKYLYISQQVSLPYTFTLDYDKSIYRAIELKDLELLEKSRIFVKCENITQPLSLLTMRPERYYILEYQNSPMQPLVDTVPGINVLFPIIDNDMVTKIRNKKYDGTIEDIIVKYFNNETITSDDIDIIQTIQYENNMYLFYRMPIVIYILDTYLKHILKA